ncbi:hypothetical protein [Endozoicomonas sp.]|uniref:hypothetical protein n=1 Tax=Endozoicomonas sp. TaxID=1892382 RepID=UPI0028889E45|nr:hypothetical protein [Endozoicomonas sp.]
MKNIDNNNSTYLYLLHQLNQKELNNTTEPLGLTKERRLVTQSQLNSWNQLFVQFEMMGDIESFDQCQQALSERIINNDVTPTKAFTADDLKKELLIKLAKSTVTIGNKEYPVVEISEKTPILFQWFNLKKLGLEIPAHYLENIKAICRLEPNRDIGLLFNGDHLSKTNQKILTQLQSEYDNFRLINFYDLEMDSVNFEITEEIIEHITSPELRDTLTELSKAKGKNLTIQEAIHLLPTYAHIDVSRFIAMNLAGKLFTENPDKSKSGCIFMDCDMELKEPIGTLTSIDGFLCYMKHFDEEIYTIEAGLFCVDRPGHPIISSILNELSNPQTDKTMTLNGYPLYVRAVKKHFSLGKFDSSSVKSKLPIAFPLHNINPDQSKTSKSTWTDQ